MGNKRDELERLREAVAQMPDGMQATAYATGKELIDEFLSQRRRSNASQVS